MKPERYARMLGYVDKHLSTDMNGQILVEKYGEVIVDLGDTLEATTAQLATVQSEADALRAKLAKVKKAGKKTGKKSVKKPLVPQA